jgi:ABC-type Mn2+/Zn2+ transport system permease subunit
MEASRNDLSWGSVIISLIFAVLGGLGLGIVIKNSWEHLGQAVSAVYGIVASIFFAIALIIFMYVSSVVKK